MEELDQIRERLRNIIVNTCNEIGCDGCGLKWPEGCSATELQSKEYELMFGGKNEN